MVRPEPPSLCPEGAGETASLGPEGNHTRSEGKSQLPWGGEVLGTGQERVTRRPRHIPGAPQRGPSHSPSFPPWEPAGTTPLTVVGFSDPDPHP